MDESKKIEVHISIPALKLNAPSEWRSWMPTKGNFLFTLLVAVILVSTQSVWARSAYIESSSRSAATVNYQGRLANNNGEPITQNDVLIRFGIFNAAEGGDLLWPVNGPEIHQVDVSNGLFTVALGSLTDGGIPTNLWSGDRYLEITIGDETLSPREIIRSVPIAGMAFTVPVGSISTQHIADASITQSKAPLLVGAGKPNTKIQYGSAVVEATTSTDRLNFYIYFEPDFSERPVVFLQPFVNQTHYLFSLTSTPCDATRCRVYLTRTDGKVWEPGQNQQVDWIAIGQ